MALAGVVFQIAAEKSPQTFGSVDLSGEAEEIRPAHAAVSEATALLASRPAVLEALRVRYNVTVPPGTQLARRLLAAVAAR